MGSKLITRPNLYSLLRQGSLQVMLWMSTRRLSAHELWAFHSRHLLPSLGRLTDPQVWAHSLSTRQLHLRPSLHPSVEVLLTARHLPLLDHLPPNDHPSVELPTRSPRLLRCSFLVPPPWGTVDLNPTTVGRYYQLCNLVHPLGPTLLLLLSPSYNDPQRDSAAFPVVHLHPCVELNLYAISQR
jgi:hypothetical protein